MPPPLESATELFRRINRVRRRGRKMDPFHVDVYCLVADEAAVVALGDEHRGKPLVGLSGLVCTGAFAERRPEFKDKVVCRLEYKPGT